MFSEINLEKAREFANCNSCYWKSDCTTPCLEVDGLLAMAEWKDEQIRKYFTKHIVHNGKHDLSLADDITRFDKEKRESIEQILKDISEIK